MEFDTIIYQILAIDLSRSPPEPCLIIARGSSSHFVDTLELFNVYEMEVAQLPRPKTYLLDDLKDWMGSEEVISTNKIDGVSCSLVYAAGILQLAKTRGDGSFGEDITQKSRWVEGIPRVSVRS